MVPLALATLAVLTRLPLLAATPVENDAVHFALALDEFDLFRRQPHPPGYILFLAPAALLHGLGLEALRSLQLVSVAWSAVAVWAVWLLARRLLSGDSGTAGRREKERRREGEKEPSSSRCLAVSPSRRLKESPSRHLAVSRNPEVAAVSVALLLLTSPLFWSRGELGLAYTAEAALQALVAGLLLHARAAPRLALAGAALGLSAGVRQSLLLFLAPLWLWCCARLGMRAALLSVAAVLAGVVVWLVPLLALVGGPGAWLAASAEQGASFANQTTLVNPRAALRQNAELVLLGTAWTGGLAWLAVPLGIRSLARTRVWPFLLLWSLPPLVFHLGYFTGQVSHLLTLAPQLAIVAGAGCAGLGRRLGGGAAAPDAEPRARQRIGLALAAALALANATLFLLAPDPSGSYATRASLEAADARAQGYRELLRERFPSETTLVVTPAGSEPGFRIAMYEYPEHRVVRLELDGPEPPPTYVEAQGRHSTFPHPSGSTPVPVGAGVRWIVVLGDVPSALAAEPSVRRETTPAGFEFAVVEFAANQSELRIAGVVFARAGA